MTQFNLVDTPETGRVSITGYWLAAKADQVVGRTVDTAWQVRHATHDLMPYHAAAYHRHASPSFEIHIRTLKRYVKTKQSKSKIIIATLKKIFVNSGWCIYDFKKMYKIYLKWMWNTVKVQLFISWLFLGSSI